MGINVCCLPLMLIDWTSFGPALLALWIPTALFAGKQVIFRPISCEWSRTQIFTLPHHVIDLVRSAVGAWLLLHSIEAAPDLEDLTRYIPVAIQGGVLIVAVVIQTVFCKEPESANAPFAFVAGIVAGFFPPVVAGFALVSAIVVSLGARTPAAFFLVLAVGIAVAGLLFEGVELIANIVVGSIAVVLPWLIALLFSRELVLAQRERRDSGTNSPFRNTEPR